MTCYSRPPGSSAAPAGGVSWAGPSAAEGKLSRVTPPSALAAVSNLPISVLQATRLTLLIVLFGLQVAQKAEQSDAEGLLQRAGAHDPTGSDMPAVSESFPPGESEPGTPASSTEPDTPPAASSAEGSPRDTPGAPLCSICLPSLDFHSSRECKLGGSPCQLHRA